MNYFESYLDEDLLNEDYYNEDLLGEDLLESYGESFDEASKKRPSTRPIRPSVSSAVKQRSNFGKSLSGRAADYATKSELKKSLDAISSQVNELKKTTLATNKALVSLDQKHTEFAKIDVRKGDNQTKVLKNMQMMNMMGSLLNQPKFVPENLTVTGVGVGVDAKISVVEGKNPIYIDQTMSLLLPMMTTMGDSGSGKSDNSMNMMLPLILISQQNNGGGTNTNNSILPIAMMMMMNK